MSSVLFCLRFFFLLSIIFFLYCSSSLFFRFVHCILNVTLLFLVDTKPCSSIIGTIISMIVRFLPRHPSYKISLLVQLYHHPPVAHGDLESCGWAKQQSMSEKLY